MLKAVAFLILFTASLMLAAGALFHPQFLDSSLGFVAITSGIAGLYLLFDIHVRQRLMGGTLGVAQEGLVIDTTFEDLKLNGKVHGTIGL
jgi:hypothetical protein